MSGGKWNYNNKSLASDIFGYEVSTSYNLEKKEKDRRLVRKKDPLKDREISEMVYDIMCLLDSYDYYDCGDTDKDQYRKDVKFFKEKWFGKTEKERANKLINDYTEEFKAELNKMFDR